jgi:CheY-like chemotaxis protein
MGGSMGLCRVLIADGNESFREALRDALKDEFHIAIACDGTHALELLQSFQPDVLVIDTMLSGLEFFSILQSECVQKLSPAILATTDYRCEYIAESAEKLNIAYIIVKPCPAKAIANRVRDLAMHRLTPYRKELFLRDAVTSILLEFGIAARTQGFPYLRDGILFYLKQPDLSITKHLYPAVAAGSATGVTKEQVERCMRTAIRSAWGRSEPALWEQYFRTNGKPPSNGVFISTLAELVRLRTAQSAII